MATFQTKETVCSIPQSSSITDNNVALQEADFVTLVTVSQDIACILYHAQFVPEVPVKVRLSVSVTGIVLNGARTVPFRFFELLVVVFLPTYPTPK